MSTPDLINGLFELVMGVMQWFNVQRLIKDREIKGVSWPIWFFISAWGLWNLFYYPHLGQMLSFWGGVLLVLANITWVSLACYYRRKKV